MRWDPSQNQAIPPHGPRIRRASWMSRCIIVTRFAWIANKFLHLNSDKIEGKLRKCARVFEQMDEICFRRLLQCHKCRTLPPKPSIAAFIHVCSHILSHLSYLMSDWVVAWSSKTPVLPNARMGASESEGRWISGIYEFREEPLCPDESGAF